MSDDALDKKKAHRERHSGRKADKKKKAKESHDAPLSDRQRNPKAFAFNSAVRAERRFRRKQDIDTKKQHIPLVDRSPLEPPPILIAVVGPPKVGKSTLIANLIKLFTKSHLTEVKGPVTIVVGKKRRVTLIECNNDVNCMIDLAKVADLALLLCDASFGFEMEVFEFLNICQVHGMPKIMGVLTHLDMIKNKKTLKSTKKKLKHRFWTEVYAGAKLFYLSGIVHGEYLRNEIKNLGRFISVMKFRPLTWRSTHSYILGDRYEDLTNQELIRVNPKCDRNISLYGYIRGIPLNKNMSVHIAGFGDLKIQDASHLPDPCPLPETIKKRALVEKEKLVYAPFSGVGGIVYDKDAVYVELGGSHSHHKRDDNDIVSNLIDTKETIDVKMNRSELQLFTGGKKITAEDMLDEKENGRIRRKVIFDDDCDEMREDESLVPNREDVDANESEEEHTKVLGDERTVDNNEMSDGDSSTSNDDNVTDTDKSKEVNADALSILDNSKLNIEQKDNVKGKESKLDAKIMDKDGMTDDNDSDVSDHDMKGGSLYTELKENKSKEVHAKITDVLKALGNTKSKVKQETDEFQLCKKDTNKKINSEVSCSSESDEDEGSDNQFSSEDEEESESDNENHGVSSGHTDEDDSSDNNNDENDMAVKWKENLARKAENAFLHRLQSKKNLMKLVYGVFTDKPLNEKPGNDNDMEQVQAEEIGGLFKVVSHEQQKLRMEKDTMNSIESSLSMPWNSPFKDFTLAENKPLVQNRFVTGKWKESEDASELLKLDSAEVPSDSDSDVFGDFEDLETGEKFSKKRKREEHTDRKALLEKKLKLKQKFDSEYDNGATYYDELKSNAEKQAQLNKSVFENMNDDIRVQIEGYRPGMYVRVEFQNVPCEFVSNFDPTYPLVIGALNIGEENVGYVNVKLKKHRWYKKILKANDPLIVSLGWRRFQVLPLYSKLEDNLKFRYLKYTPQHLTCNAHFWGPITPQGTGFIALQTCESNLEVVKHQGFRIAATGSVQEMDKSSQIMKKLKLIGYPMKIYKKTAFIKGMFNSSLEVARFEGARIKTVSGIRGQIKKAASKPEGCFRATFEDKIQLSDIVFCRTWYKVDVQHFYNPVTTLLLPPDKKNSWKGVRSIGELKREEGIKNPAAINSLYTEIVRESKVFKPLVIPKKLQQALPYRDKTKHGVKLSDKKKTIDRVAVVKEPHEQKISKMIKMIKASYQHKQEQLKVQTKERLEKHRRAIEAQEAKKYRKLQQQKKDVFRSKSKAQIREERKSSKGNVK